MENQKPKKVKVKKVNYKTGNEGSKKNIVIIGSVGAAVIVLAAIIFMTLSSLFSTETYYVLNENVKSKQQIAPEMVVARETAEGTAPVNSLSMEEIQRGNVYSKYPLYAGDVISRSNSGAIADITSGIPDGWSITSFTINSTDAAGGILSKGDYADLLGVDDKGAQYILNNLMILEVKFLNAEYDGTALEGQTVVGETIHYTIGLPADKAALFHDALKEYEVVKLIKAPYEVNYKERDLSSLNKTFKYDSNTGNIDVFEGTDPTFTEIERDEKGQPIIKTEENSEAEELQENSSEQ